MNKVDKINNVDKLYGKKIRTLRKKNGHTLKQLADLINYDFSNFSKIERGERKITISMLEDIANAYQVHISYFTGEHLNREWQEFKQKMDSLSIKPLQLDKLVMSALNLNEPGKMDLQNRKGKVKI